MRHFYIRKTAARALLPLITIFAIAAPAFSLDIIKEVTKGVTLMQRINDNPTFPMLTNVLSVDLAEPDIQIKAALGRGVIYTDDTYKGKENVASMVERSGALAGINTDFFPMEWGGDPLGVCVVDGELVSEPCGNRAAFGITTDNRAVFDIPSSKATITCTSGKILKLDGINKPRGTGQLVAYTAAFGSKLQSKYAVTYVRCSSDDLPVRANKPIQLNIIETITGSPNIDIRPGEVVLAGGGDAAKLIQNNLKDGDRLTMRFEIKSQSGFDWGNVEQAVGGGPWLVRDGVEALNPSAEGFKGSLVTDKHPRTALGITEDNKLLLVTVDGRQGLSKGMSLSELASHMRRLGAKNAINLDGGGSTAMSIRGFVVNSPSGGTERYVANALLLFNKTLENQLNADVKITGLEDTIAAGGFAHLSAANIADDSPLSEEEMSKVIWGSKSGMGFIDQMGRYTPTKARTGDICLAYGPSVIKQRVMVVAAPTAAVTAKIVPDKQYPYRATLQITSKDKLGNPTGDKKITLSTSGLTLDKGAHVTDKNGNFEIGLTLDNNTKPCKITVKIDNISTTAEYKPGK